ncbi:carbohydrate ABC transporter permease [Cohnella sp. 56]|uniref:carbohydrate ABC transporter permease n=1 Tax=Cohnella sp. 56 TaxID=3113722 RepID=UPI0030E762BD
MKKRTREDWVLDSINYALLIIIALVALYPFYYILVLSFNEGTDTTRSGVYFWPRRFTLDNYHYFFKDPKWTRAFVVTLLRTVIGTGLGVIFTSLVAYGLTYKDLMFRRTYFVIVLVAMNFSGGIITYYVTLKGLGLLNTFSVYVVPTMLNLFFLMIALSFFREIPPELGESARMEGASEWRIFSRIIMPVSMPLLATMSLFVGSGQWNSWLDAAYFVQDDGLRTLAYRMIEVINQAMLPTDTQSAQIASMSSVTGMSVQVTAMIISIAPIICVYPFLQKYFVKGMMLGSVKG